MKALAAALASLWPLAALACADGGYQELDHRHRTPGDALRDMRRGEAKVCAVVDVRAPRRVGEEADFWFVRRMRDRRDGGIALDRLPTRPGATCWSSVASGSAASRSAAGSTVTPPAWSSWPSGSSTRGSSRPVLPLGKTAGSLANSTASVMSMW
jgi:hypothetical protein